MKNKLGHYEIVSELGRGGMGVVLKGFEPALNRHVAIKVLSEALAHDPSVVERFSREARAMAALNDPHIIQIYFIGEDQGQPYFVMEYVEGETLSALLKREHRLSPERAREILLQAASGLATAHDKGVIHRDIKPGNLMINPRGMVKVADFGIALAGTDLSKKLTSTGEFVGTPGYLSPEVCLGKTVDERTDIFSLGIVFFEMLTGKMPFTDESPLGLMLEVVRAEVPDVRQLNGAVDDATYDILQKMIAKDPADRFISCHDLVDALRAVGTMSPSTVNARATPAPVPAQPGAATAAYVTPSSLQQQPPTLHPSAHTARPAPSTAPTPLRNNPAPPTLPRFATNAPPMVSGQQVNVMQATAQSPRKSPIVALSAIAAALVVLIGGGAWAYSSGWIGGGNAGPTPAAASGAESVAKPFGTAATLAAAASSSAAQASTEPTLTNDPSALANEPPPPLPAGVESSTGEPPPPLPAGVESTASTNESATPAAPDAAMLAQVEALKAEMAQLKQAEAARAAAATTASAAPERPRPVVDKLVAMRQPAPPVSGPPRIFVMSAGDRTISEPAEQAIESALINAGVSIADESFQGGISAVLRSGGGDLPGKIAKAVGARPKDILILVRAIPQGTQNINFYGQSSTLITANLTVQGFLLGQSRPMSGAESVRVNFTQLNAAQQAEIAVQDLLPRLVSNVKRNRG